MNSILTSISWTDILVTIVSLALTWALAQASDWLKSKSEANKVKTQNESVKNYIQIALDTTSQVVDMLNTTVVNDWKKAAADGKLTDEEIDAITAEARTKVMTILSQSAVTALQQVYGDLNSMIDTWVKNAVEKAKETTGLTSDEAIAAAATKPAVENSSGETTATSPDAESAVEVGDPAESHSNTMAGSAK